MGEANTYTTQGGYGSKTIHSHLLGMRRGPEGHGNATVYKVLAANGWQGAGKVIIITGASGGLGKESARAFAAAGAEVILAVRDLDCGNDAAADIQQQHPGAKVIAMHCDMASLSSISAFADAFLALKKPLHVLMANAGIMACPFGLTADGHELQFGTNHLGHFALVTQLLPVLKATGQQAGEAARIVVVSSSSHFTPYPVKQGGPLQLQSYNEEASYHPFFAYGQSKLANVLMVRELHKRLTAEGAPVLVTACHPGMSITGIGRHVADTPFLKWAIGVACCLPLLLVCRSTERAAATQVHLSTSPNILSGELYGPDGRLHPSSVPSHDADLGAKLWVLSERLVAKAKAQKSETAAQKCEVAAPPSTDAAAKAGGSIGA